MKNVRLKVMENCSGNYWWFSIFEGKKQLMLDSYCYERKGNAIRAANAMAKRIGIKYDPEIIKLHGC